MALSMTIGDLPIFWHWRRCGILICPGYPKVAWRELREEQKKDIKVYFGKIKPTPLITNSWLLNALHVFDRFKHDAELVAREIRKGVVPCGSCPAIVGDEAVKHVVITIDYRRKKAMQKKLSAWLNDDANSKLFHGYYRRQIDKRNLNSPNRYKELLKFLAAWRLHVELGFKEAANWTKKIAEAV